MTLLPVLPDWTLMSAGCASLTYVAISLWWLDGDTQTNILCRIPHTHTAHRRCNLFLPRFACFPTCCNIHTPPCTAEQATLHTYTRATFRNGFSTPPFTWFVWCSAGLNVNSPEHIWLSLYSAIVIRGLDNGRATSAAPPLLPHLFTAGHHRRLPRGCGSPFACRLLLPFTGLPVMPLRAALHL